MSQDPVTNTDVIKGLKEFEIKCEVDDSILDLVNKIEKSCELPEEYKRKLRIHR